MRKNVNKLLITALKLFTITIYRGLLKGTKVVNLTFIKN